VLSQALLSPNEAVLVLNEQFGADGAGVSGPLTLRNIQGVWKVVVFNTRDADGKVTSLDLYKSR